MSSEHRSYSYLGHYTLLLNRVSITKQGKKCVLYTFPKVYRIRAILGSLDLFFNNMHIFYFCSYILGKKTPRIPGPKYDKHRASNIANRSFRNTISQRPQSTNPNARRASTAGLHTPTLQEETWTSFHEKWPSWQIFR